MAGASGEFSVASILSSISNTIGEISQQDMEASGNYKAVGEVIRAEQASQEAAAKDAMLVEQAKQAGVLQQQHRISAVMEAMNFDTLSVDLATKLSESGKKLEALQTSIDKKNSVGFLDNPVMWLGAQLSVQPDIEAYNAEVDKYSLTESHSKAINNMAQEVATTARAALTTVTADSAAAASRIAGAQYNTAAREANIKALVNDTAELKFMRESSLQQIALRADGRRTLDAAEDQERQRAAFAMQREQHALAMANGRRQAEAAKREDEFEVKMLQLINTGAQRIGRRPFISLDDYKLFEKSNKVNAELAQQMSNIGYSVLDAASTGKVGSVKLGEYSGDVARLLVEGRGTLKQSPAVDKLLKDAYINAKSGGSGAVGLDVKNPVAVSEHVTRVVRGRAAIDARDVNVGGKNNIYAPPTFAEMIAVAGKAELEMPVLYNKLFADSVKANPMQQVDPAVLYHKAIEGVIAGKVTINEAVDGLNMLGAMAVGTNNGVRNYGAAGVAKQTSYGTNTKLTSASFFGRDIDLIDRTKLMSMFAIAVATEKTTRYQRAFSASDVSAMQAIGR